MATSLDPRFKIEYISEDNKTTVKARLTREIIIIIIIIHLI